MTGPAPNPAQAPPYAQPASLEALRRQYLATATNFRVCHRTPARPRPIPAPELREAEQVLKRFHVRYEAELRRSMRFWLARPDDPMMCAGDTRMLEELGRLTDSVVGRPPRHVTAGPPIM